MRRLLAVFAHPDDEGMIAGTLAHYARNGAHVSLICTTKGEAGEISDSSIAVPGNLGSVREAELRCACDVIGIDDLHLLGYCDSGMDGTPENEKATAFIHADPDEVLHKLVKLMRRIRPHAVFTFEPKGWYGHPDHIAAGRYATEAYYLSGDADAFPDAGRAWKPNRLFHVAFLRSSFRVVADYMREQGHEEDEINLIDWDEPDYIEDQITHVFDVSDYVELKQESLSCHRTQFGDNHLFNRLPPEIARSAHRNEYFVQVEPPAEPSLSRNGDLLSGFSE
jgi:LmbE family N-acetylglucosaminyl deacetylase